MYYNVSQLLQEPEGSKRSFDVDGTVDILDHDIVVNGSMNMLKTDKGIWVSANVEANVYFSCGRCLAESEINVRMKLEEEYLPEFDVVTGKKLHEPNGTEENFFVGHSNFLDLTEAIKQYVDMNTPMKVVCKAECAGICVECGEELNKKRLGAVPWASHCLSCQEKVERGLL